MKQRTTLQLIKKHIPESLMNYMGVGLIYIRSFMDESLGWFDVIKHTNLSVTYNMKWA